MARARAANVDDIDTLVRHKNRIQDTILREKGDHLGLSKKNVPEKFMRYFIVTLIMLSVGAILYAIFTCMKSRGKQRGARIARVTTAVAFTIGSCVLTMIPDFLQTKDKKNGWRNLMLIYYANLNLIIFVISVSPERLSVPGLIDLSSVLCSSCSIRSLTRCLFVTWLIELICCWITFARQFCSPFSSCSRSSASCLSFRTPCFTTCLWQALFRAESLWRQLASRRSGEAKMIPKMVMARIELIKSARLWKD